MRRGAGNFTRPVALIGSRRKKRKLKKPEKPDFLMQKQRRKKKRKVKQKERTDWYQGYLSIQH